MNDEQRMVADFHRAFDVAIETSPVIPDEATRALRVSLIQEEFDELREALIQRDMEAVAKELADLLYVVYGTAVACGLDMAPIFREVHRSNMSKVGGHKRADGKWIKPPNYSPAHLRPLLAAQEAQGSATDGAHQDTGEPTPRTPGTLVRPTTSLPISLAAPIGTESPEVRHAPAAAPGDSAPGDESRAPRLHSGRRETVPPAHHDDTQGRAPRLRPCVRCGKSFFQRSHHRGMKERLLSLVYIYPFRCQICGYRFRSFQFRVRYTKKLVDRRHYERLPTRVPTAFAEAIKPGEYRVGEGVVTNISLRDCYLQTAARLVEGALVSLELQTAAHAPAIVVEAAIVRSLRPTGVGLEFLRLHEAEHERLSQFIRQLLIERHRAEDATQSL